MENDTQTLAIVRRYCEQRARDAQRRADRANPATEPAVHLGCQLQARTYEDVLDVLQQAEHGIVPAYVASGR